MTSTLAHQLATFACSLRFEDLSREVVHEVKRRIIDSIGCALGAWNEQPCVIARQVASEFSARHGATIIGTTHSEVEGKFRSLVEPSLGEARTEEILQQVRKLDEAENIDQLMHAMSYW